LITGLRSQLTGNLHADTMLFFFTFFIQNHFICFLYNSPSNWFHFPEFGPDQPGPFTVTTSNCIQRGRITMPVQYSKYRQLFWTAKGLKQPKSTACHSGIITQQTPVINKFTRSTLWSRLTRPSCSTHDSLMSLKQLHHDLYYFTIDNGWKDSAANAFIALYDATSQAPSINFIRIGATCGLGADANMAGI
jgi:hypothetical protein